MYPWSTALAGRLDEHVVSSELLRGNPLGDSPDRDLIVYVPPGYEDSPEQRYPTVYVLQGYTGTLGSWHNESAYSRTFYSSADAMFARGDAPPAIVAFVDGWNLYGGSQYIDSPGTGQHHAHFCEEVVPFVDSRYRTLADREHRGLMGHSSGGYGSAVTSMLRPDLFGAFVKHAGDAGFEMCYLPSIPDAVRALRDYDSDVWRWWEDFRTRAEDNLAFSKPGDGLILVYLGLAACYSPDGDAKPALPFDPRTGSLRPEHWERWLAWDPVRMVSRHAEAMRSMRGIWIDAGRRDDFHLDLGAEAFRDALVTAGVSVDAIRFELHDGTHAISGDRLMNSLTWLTKLLTP
ncbi:alpha/beta hydrolase [Tenggerimyces flavus]|uniref:Alpha/beta hydrolase n=1 Tax=Tenggerimyces flavus TaxID=1708749 RepID=A0ABV7YE17_9ACTN|nr:alpha/beta hydrolase-fold protein [Tenggerimyces flavus]MBM7786094.1 S-formylglutathione hydrolase FrmB [Tenggerimyces flavus]